MNNKVIVKNKEGREFKYLFHIEDYKDINENDILFTNEDGRKYRIIVIDDPQKAYELLNDYLCRYKLHRIEFKAYFENLED